MSVPDAWDDEWSNTADVRLISSPFSANPGQTQQPETKKLSTKQTKAQKRAAQAEFNRQIWAEAETPQETNYFLESRNVIPLRQEFKAAPTLLSRKGPIVQKKPKPVDASLEGLTLNEKEESSEDEDETVAQLKALEAAKVQAAKEREEKQKKYEERRLELFGPTNSQQPQKSGESSPNLTPPGSRSATPRGRRGRGRGQHGRKESQLQGQNQNVLPTQLSQPQSRLSQPVQQGQYAQVQQPKEVYDPGYAPKPAIMRREPQNKEAQPVREPKAPDGSGRGGGGFVQRRSLVLNATAQPFEY